MFIRVNILGQKRCTNGNKSFISSFITLSMKLDSVVKFYCCFVSASETDFKNGGRLKLLILYIKNTHFNFVVGGLKRLGLRTVIETKSLNLLHILS